MPQPSIAFRCSTRNVYDLVQLSAGVTPANGSPNSSNSEAIINISSGRPGVDVSSYTINGAILGSVYYMLDGSPLGIAENNIAAIIPAVGVPEDGVDEYRVETQNTPASYQSGGRASSAWSASPAETTSMAMPSASSVPTFLPPTTTSTSRASYHVDPVTARRRLNTPPAFHRYQEGGSISGPILHKKLFFFGDYEATQQELFDGSNIFSVPTTAERDRRFLCRQLHHLRSHAARRCHGTAGRNAPARRRKHDRQPQPHRAEVSLRVSQVQFPDPNTCEANATSGPYGDLNNLYLPGLDPIIGAAASTFASTSTRAKSSTSSAASPLTALCRRTFNAFDSMWDPNYAQNVTNGRNILVADDLTLSPTTVLQLRYSFTRHYENQGGDPAQNGFDITTLGFPSSLAARGSLQDPASHELQRRRRSHRRHLLLQHVPIRQRKQRRHRHAHQGERQARTQHRLRIHEALHECRPAALPFRQLLLRHVRNRPDHGASSPVGGNDFASFLFGMGTAPGSESTNFTKDLFVAEASPYYAAFIQDTYHITPSFTSHRGSSLGHLRRQNGAP